MSMLRKREREFQHAAAAAARYAMENCGAKPGDELSADQRAKLAPLMMEKIAPYITNLLTSRPAPAGLNSSPEGPVFEETAPKRQ